MFVYEFPHSGLRRNRSHFAGRELKALLGLGQRIGEVDQLDHMARACRVENHIIIGDPTAAQQVSIDDEYEAPGTTCGREALAQLGPNHGCGLRAGQHFAQDPDRENLLQLQQRVGGALTPNEPVRRPLLTGGTRHGTKAREVLLVDTRSVWSAGNTAG
jgi:hypothetical protein